MAPGTDKALDKDTDMGTDIDKALDKDIHTAVPPSHAVTAAPPSADLAAQAVDKATAESEHKQAVVAAHVFPKQDPVPLPSSTQVSQAASPVEH
jgi:hypothetical protein